MWLIIIAGLLVFAFLLMAFLKICGIILISWFLVFLPILLPFFIYVFLVISIYILKFFIKKVEKNENS